MRLRDTAAMTWPMVLRVEWYGEGSTDVSGRGSVSTKTEAELRWWRGRPPKEWNEDWLSGTRWDN